MTITFYGTDHRRPHPRAKGYHAVVDFEHDDPHFLNLSNLNARMLLVLLGFAPPPVDGPILDRPAFDESSNEPDYLVGEQSVLKCRLAITRARKFFDRRAPRLTFPDETLYRSDGTVRAHLTGLDVEGLQSRLERFALLVDVLCNLGSTHVVWS